MLRRGWWRTRTCGAQLADVVWLSFRGRLGLVCCELPALRLLVAEFPAGKALRVVRFVRVSVLRVLLLAVMFSLALLFALALSFVT